MEFSPNHVLLFVLFLLRYRFGCRQVAIDENHEVRVFTAKQDEVTTISITTTLTIALVRDHMSNAINIQIE